MSTTTNQSVTDMEESSAMKNTSTDVGTVHCTPCEKNPSTPKPSPDLTMLEIMNLCGLEESYYRLDSNFKKDRIPKFDDQHIDMAVQTAYQKVYQYG